mgnify:CR=1 FL=1
MYAIVALEKGRRESDYEQNHIIFVEYVPDCEYGANGTFVFSDAGLNQNPNSEELAAIAQSSAQSFKQLVGEEPVVAMLSHSTFGSAKHADVDKVVEATAICKANNPGLKVDGDALSFGMHWNF